MEKENKAYHITWATHNSRISERMVKYKVKKGDPFIFTEQMRNDIYKHIIEKIQKNNYNVIEFNVLSDHVHLIILCHEKELNQIVRNLKGYSSFLFCKQLNLSIEGAGRQNKIWAKGYSHTFLRDDEHFLKAIEYVKNNHIKHNIPSIIK